MENLENIPTDTQSYYSNYTPQFVYASQGKRLANYLLDVVFGYIFIIILSFTLGIVLTLTTGSLSAVQFMGQRTVSIVLACIMLVLYYFIFESSTKGKTIGKLITGTIAVQEDLSPITPKQAFLRSLIRLIPFEPFSAFGGTPWHDKWTKTMVIEKNSIRMD